MIEMPVPDTHALTVYSVVSLPNTETGSKTEVQVPKDATVADVIEAALDNFSITAGPEHFDLWEVEKDDGQFSNNAEVIHKNSRPLSYAEFPVDVTRKWSCGDVFLSDHENDEAVNGDSKTTKEEKGEQCRLYLAQKYCGLQENSEVQITWYDGLNKNIRPDEWHFEPYYRGENEIDDLINLPQLTEAVLLDELCVRFCRGRIYTYVGGILIAVNPFKYFPLYNPKYIKAYQHRKLGELPPHVFAIADAAYARMLQDKHDQCIVISGESGSGKTESTKLILHHLTALSHKTKATLLEKTILHAGPVLEAFGNAKTFHNNNSSRFGKFTQINYRADGVVCGAVLKKYLLEKSRIVSQAVGERNYHVFYYLLAGASTTERENLHLECMENYHYLNQSKCYTIDGVDDVYEFSRLKSSIKNIGLQHGIQQRMFAVLSAVLLIGNISFNKRTTVDDGTVNIFDGPILDTISKLLQVDKEGLMAPLTMRKTITRGEEFVRFYKIDEAVATRDSMAKCLYASLFDWIVLQTNHIMVNRQGRNPDKKEFSIGVLDIFGFEDFEVNSFEQFCINLANENLQYYLNQHIFTMIQEEYKTEGINWSHVEYVDNVNCLNLIVGRPVGLILLLDEECSLTMGTDESLLDKFNTQHQNNEYYVMPPMRKPVFSIVHYAGTVKYQIKGFRTKNRDLMRNDIVAAFKNSRMLFVRELMGSDPMAIYYWSVLRHVIKAVSIFKKAGAARAKSDTVPDEKPKVVAWANAMTPPPTRTKLLMKQLTMAESNSHNQAQMRRATKVMNRSRRVQELTKIMQCPSKVRSGLNLKRSISGGMSEFAKRGGLKSPPTVVAQFQSSLQELMDTLNNSHPFFVRCIRSNAKKAPLDFDAALVQTQLRYTGMLETVKIRQAGYACRIPISDFMNNYKLLWPSDQTISTAEDISNLLIEVGVDKGKFQIGKTKIYMNEKEYTFLKKKHEEKIHDFAIVIQRWMLSVSERRKFSRKRAVALKWQALWRGYKCRKQYQVLLIQHYAAKRIQDYWRDTKHKKAVRENKFDRFKVSIVLVQAIWRGYSARKRYTRMLVEKREEEENKKIQEDAERNVNEAIKDTIFTNDVIANRTDILENDIVQLNKHDNNRDNKDLLITTNDVATVTNDINTNDIHTNDKKDKEEGEVICAASFSSGGKVYHHYEDINDIQTVFRSGSVGSATQSNIPPDIHSHDRVKLRTSTGATIERTPENRKQKLYRRLSFSAKDKIKYSSGIRKAKEAEDDSFVDIQMPPPIADDTKRNSTQKSNISINAPQAPKQNTIAGFFHALQRKGSRRDLTGKGEKKINRRNSAILDENNEYLLNGEDEFEVFNLFLMKKVSDMNREEYGGADGEMDTIFKNALHKYHGNLLVTCVNNVQRQEPVALKVNDLVNGFSNVLNQRVNTDTKISKDFSIIGGNLFRGIIEEFVKNKDILTRKRRQKKPIKRKRRKTVEYFEHKGHIYHWQSFNINTYCEYCNAYIYEKGLECQACSFTCHKKCHHKYNKACKGRRPSLCGPAALYGTDLSEITSPNNPIPQAIIKLMLEIEKRGLHAEGLYRKPGLQAAINNLKSVITSIDAESLLLEDERPHTLASVLKLFFRQLPKPLICHEFDEDFIRCTDLETEEDMQTTMYELIQRFPKANKELLERVIVHLARVAMLEEYNKMSPNGLAIIWAPVLMRAAGKFETLDCLQRLPKQTKCIEVLITVQVRNTQDRLNDIDALHKATTSFENRLDFIEKERKSSEKKDEITDGLKSTEDDEFDHHDEEVELLQMEISNMEDERRRLTIGLANMAPHKRSSVYSLDELGFETDEEIIDGQVKRKKPKRNSQVGRPKLTDGQDSSFEDIDVPDSSGKLPVLTSPVDIV